MKTAQQRGKASREKGKRFERQVANAFKEAGYEAYRSQQFSGKNNDADVIVNLPLHVECKFVERLNIDNAMEQSIRDARENEIPIVVHKKSRKQMLVTMRWDDFLKLISSGNAEYMVTSTVENS